MRKIINLEVTIAGLVGVSSIPIVKWAIDCIEMQILAKFFPNSRYSMEIWAAKIRSGFPDAASEPAYVLSSRRQKFGYHLKRPNDNQLNTYGPADLNDGRDPPCRRMPNESNDFIAIVKYELTEFPTFKAVYRCIRGDDSLYL